MQKCKQCGKTVKSARQVTICRRCVKFIRENCFLADVDPRLVQKPGHKRKLSVQEILAIAKTQQTGEWAQITMLRGRTPKQLAHTIKNFFTRRCMYVDVEPGDNAVYVRVKPCQASQTFSEHRENVVNVESGLTLGESVPLVQRR